MYFEYMKTFSKTRNFLNHFAYTTAKARAVYIRKNSSLYHTSRYEMKLAPNAQVTHIPYILLNGIM